MKALIIIYFDIALNSLVEAGSVKTGSIIHTQRHTFNGDPTKHTPNPEMFASLKESVQTSGETPHPPHKISSPVYQWIIDL